MALTAQAKATSSSFPRPAWDRGRPVAVSATPEPAPIDAAGFCEIFRAFPSGVSIVTALDRESRPVGLTVTAVASLSVDPPQLLACIDNAKYTLQAIAFSGSFAVNFLAADQQWISERFSRPHRDKFSHVRWCEGQATRAPVISGVRAHAECEVERLVASGDHTIVIGRVLAGGTAPGPSLVYCERSYAAVARPETLGPGSDVGVPQP